MTSKKGISSLLILIVVFLLINSELFSQVSFNVVDVKVEGNKVARESLIKSVANITPGTQLSATTTQGAIGRLYRLGFFKDGDIYTDHPPEKTQWLKCMAMIYDNYYTVIADDLTDEEMQVKTKELRKPCNSAIKPL